MEGFAEWLDFIASPCRLSGRTAAGVLFRGGLEGVRGPVRNQGKSWDQEDGWVWGDVQKSQCVWRCAWHRTPLP